MSNWKDRDPPTLPLNKANERAEEVWGINHGPGAPRMFGNGATEYFKRFGGDERVLAKIGELFHVMAL